ncbi:MAG: bifunctional hydroxymethylpyrimidine kinase/phosphomethylpyrimidine kinase [Desulfobacterales bacterium]|nr:bifunctional hydroxymethylpyrimidine kinase/phosphomethylpyrimidine kinase [Desulfobacterales bacterium]
MNKTYRKVLTIAGSDSGGGAGIQADLKTFSALRCYGMSVITALTAQNTTSVTGIHAVPASFVEEQMEAVLTDIGTDAVKIGMLFSVELIESVARQLKKHGISRIVLDPVMVAKSGDKLLKDDSIEALKEHIIPLADIITPNLPEASVLTGHKLEGPEDMLDAARDIARFGGRSVVIKGGHIEKGNCTDLLYIADKDYSVVLEEERTETVNNHGTGCTFSSATASFLAKGDSIEDAVRNAKKYISKAIQAGAGYKIGNGHGPVHHFFEFWD